MSQLAVYVVFNILPRGYERGDLDIYLGNSLCFFWLNRKCICQRSVGWLCKSRRSFYLPLLRSLSLALLHECSSILLVNQSHREKLKSWKDHHLFQFQLFVLLIFGHLIELAQAQNQSQATTDPAEGVCVCLSLSLTQLLTLHIICSWLSALSSLDILHYT